MKQIKLFVIACILAVLAGSPVTAESPNDPVVPDPVVAVDMEDVLEADFLGVGVQWSSYPEFDITEADWQKVFKRVEYLKLPFTRVMLSANWYCTGFDEDGEPIYDWDNKNMTKLYKLLDWCEAHGTIVMIGEWNHPAGRPLRLTAENPKWARLIGDFLEHMIYKKKYTCLKYYNMINEPHGWWMGLKSWDQWKTGIDNLYKELEKRGLLAKIQIASPDGDIYWTTRVLKDPQLNSQTGIYDEHWYMWADDVAKGIPEFTTREQLRQIRRMAPGKQYFLGEMGLIDDKDPQIDCQYHVFDFWYGVSMTDAAVQMLRAGMSGFIAWYLDDSMHSVGQNRRPGLSPYERRKIWGFWSILGAENGQPQDENLRPWFYPWSLLTRYFPNRCQTLETEPTGTWRLNIASARIRAGDGKYHLSFAVVNNADRDRRVKIVVPKAGGKVTLTRYDYFDANGDNKVDAWPEVVDSEGNDIYPRPVATLKNVDLRSGIDVKLPTKGVVILTTMDSDSTVWVKKQSADNHNADATVAVDASKVLVEDFLGAGIQCSGYPWFNVSDADWQKVFKRLDYIKLPFTRVMVDWTSFFEGLDENGDPKYIFESPKMRNTYKLLDYCQANNIRVMFGHWGWTNTAKHQPGQNWDIKPDSKLHAKMSADLIDYVVNKKGYSCIVWFDPINEPDGNWSSCKGDWDLWARVAKQLNKEIVKRGLDKKIRISGPADVFRGWIPNALEDKELRKFLAAYNEHRYLRNKDVVSGAFEDRARQRVNSINSKDPKQYFVGELGFLDGKTKNDQQPNVLKFWYGVSMADAAIQMMRAGMDGFLAWYLDDAMHWAGDSDGPLQQPDNAYELRKIWGMWNIVGGENGMPEDESPRPWFYTWSQLSRNFPPGCQTLHADATGVEKLRVSAARIPDGGKFGFSFAVVNNSAHPRTVKIVVPAAAAKTSLSRYDYFDTDGDNKVDDWPKVVDGRGNDIYPTPTAILKNIDLARGMDVTLPSVGVVILTTLEKGASIPLKD
jgi:hypothetical protein